MYVLGWESTQFEVSSGVPQGSHIGPLLFNIFINDVVKVFKFAKVLMYADDLKIYCSVKSVADAIALQHDIDLFAVWCQKNRLSLNVDKCKCMSFYRSRRPIHFEYSIDSVTLCRLTEVRDLGVLFDTQIDFTRHIEYIIAKSYSMLGFLKRICVDFKCLKLLKSLYCAHVRSHLEYASVLWSPTYNIHISRIESIQKKFLLYALRRMNFNDHLPSYLTRCDLIDIQSLVIRREHSGVFFIYDLLLGFIDAPVLLSCLNMNAAAFQLRSHVFFRPSFHRTNYGNSEALERMSRSFNQYDSIFDLHLSRFTFRKLVRAFVVP